MADLICRQHTVIRVLGPVSRSVRRVATADGSLPVRYLARRVGEPIVIDGDLSKPVWTAAEQSGRFVDMVDGGPALYDTRMAALWDDDFLYVAMWAQEPFLAATQTERDSIVFVDNDLEVFVDGGDAYYEFEVNALGTVYEVLFVWKDALIGGGRFDRADLDIRSPRALTFAGDYDRSGQTFWNGSHPRGPRWAFLDFDLPGMQVAVKADGTINDHRDVDRGWTVELALPWQALCWMADRPAVSIGDQWRVFFGRFQRLVASGVEVQPHPASVLSPHGTYDTHLPDRFPIVELGPA